jgi:hypothetical protein
MGIRMIREKGKVLSRLKNNQKGDLCFYCSKSSHWKKICKLFLEEEKKKGSVTISLCILLLKLICLLQTSWVLDTGCAIHICKMWRYCKIVEN